MPELVHLFLFIVLAVIALAVARQQNLFAAVVLTGIYSLMSASVFVVLDAVDVAFTEAAVGAGISTILFLAAMRLAGREEKPVSRPQWLPLLTALATGGALVYGTADLPPFGAADNPIHRHVAPRYLNTSQKEIGLPNVVTSVLASYRGYDTMGELAVIFTSGTGVLLLLGRYRREGDGP